VYEPIKAIGRGAYGVVCSARNRRTGEKVAIKKVGNIFGNLVDARRALREVRAHGRADNLALVLPHKKMAALSSVAPCISTCCCFGCQRPRPRTPVLAGAWMLHGNLLTSVDPMTASFPAQAQDAAGCLRDSSCARTFRFHGSLGVALTQMTLLRRLRHENVIAVVDIMAPPAAQAWTPPASASAWGYLPHRVCRQQATPNSLWPERQNGHLTACGQSLQSLTHRRSSACQAGKFADIYLVYDLMDTDLHQIIRSPQPLSDEHVQYFIYQARSSMVRERKSLAPAWTTMEQSNLGWPEWVAMRRVLYSRGEVSAWKAAEADLILHDVRSIDTYHLSWFCLVVADLTLRMCGQFGCSSCLNRPARRSCCGG